MNFYIDFEATQFTEEIISIGCVAENGNTFNCLVVPSDLKKITPFITKLTGITREMVEEEGYSPEMAFCHLMTFVKENNGDELPVYYCYGNQDKTFIKNTIKYMRNFNMMVFASSVRDMMVDYSAVVKNHLATCGLSLKKLVALIRHVDDVEQKHDALDDAMMLKECYEGLGTISKDEFQSIRQVEVTKCNTAFQEAYNQIIDENGKLSPVRMSGRNFTVEDKTYLKNLRMNVWGHQAKVETITGDASEDDWQVKLTHIRTGDVKYFTAPWVAAMFFNGYILNGRSPKDSKSLNGTMKEMANNPNNFCGYRCELSFKNKEVKEGE